MGKINKNHAERPVEEFFSDVKNKTPEQIRKIKRLAMHHSIKLGGKRKLFCQKCFSGKLKVKSIKNKLKTVKCENCGNLARWRL